LLSLKEINKRIFDLNFDSSDIQFNEIAMEVFLYQFQYNAIYRQYVLSLKINPIDVTHYSQIPFLPIEFFKSHEIICNRVEENAFVFQAVEQQGKSLQNIM
jgi:hypothetical protein